jgi:4'-phosphopantetheinyl transferase
VWKFACRQDPGGLAASLSAAERERASRFATPALRDAYIVQHAMMRGLLSRYVALPASALRFGATARGKPTFPGIDFNLAHAEDLALLAVTYGAPIGVDLERHDAQLDIPALCSVVLSRDEQSERDPRQFMRVWCRKEACLKATGVGLLDDLKSVSVMTDRVGVAGSAVYVRDFDVGREHAAAVAMLKDFAPPRSQPVEKLEVTS